MTSLTLPTEQSAALDHAIDCGRTVVDAQLVDLAQACIDHVLCAGPAPAPVDERDRDVVALLEQMLVDVANLDEATVMRADRHFEPGQLADLVMTSYALEARTRLRLACSSLGGPS